MRKQDKTTPRTPTDLERKYNLGGTEKKTKDNDERLIQLNIAFAQFQTLVNKRIEELNGKLNEFCCYPVGTIHINTDKSNPAQLLGGEWELYMEGYLVLGAEPVEEEVREQEYAPDKCYVWRRIK